jgi:hypothetical protein
MADRRNAWNRQSERPLCLNARGATVVFALHQRAGPIMSSLAVGLGAAMGAAALAMSAHAAQTTESSTSEAGEARMACGFRMGALAFREWTLLGGEDGRLGCPTANETDIPPSAKGTMSREIVFGDRAAIFTILPGPGLEHAVTISDCYRLFYQYGGASGWLGLPLADAVNTPDGRKQAYEGGEMRFERALDSCEATRTGEEP